MARTPTGELQWHIGRYDDMSHRRDRDVLTLADFTNEDIVALEEVRAPESSKAFDREF